MTKEQLVKLLTKYAEDDNWERAHGDADDALIAYINDPEIRKAFDAVGKWYV